MKIVVIAKNHVTKLSHLLLIIVKKQCMMKIFNQLQQKKSVMKWL